MMIHINIMDTIINEEILNDEIIINQRDLKIKMTKENMLYLFNNNKEIGYYLFKKTQTFSTGFGECVHLMIIEFLDNKKIEYIGTYNKNKILIWIWFMVN